MTDLDDSGCVNKLCGANGCGGLSGPFTGQREIQEMEKAMKVDLRGREKGYCYNAARDCPPCVDQTHCDPDQGVPLFHCDNCPENGSQILKVTFSKEDCEKLIYKTPESTKVLPDPDKDPDKSAWINADGSGGTKLDKDKVGGVVDSDLEACDETIWTPPRYDPELPPKDYKQASSTKYFACRYPSDFNGKFTTVHSWWYRTGQKKKGVTGASPGFIGQLPDPPDGIKWKHEIAQKIEEEQADKDTPGSYGFETAHSVSNVLHKRLKCQPWCRYMTGFPCVSHSSCADCDFCMEEQRCEADCTKDGDDHVEHNPWRCLTSKCTGCHFCQDHKNRPCPQWRIIEHNCVLYVEDLHWSFINATINHYKRSHKNDFKRILYPLMYDTDCPACLKTATGYYESLYLEGGCDAIPAVRDSYFFLPVQAEVGPFFQCPSPCEVCNEPKGKAAAPLWPSPFDCKLTDNKKWYNADFLKENLEMPDPMEYLKGPGKGRALAEDLRLFAVHVDGAAENKLQVPLLAKIFGGSVVLLCVSVVCTALSRSRRASSGYDIAEQVENGQAHLSAYPQASGEALIQQE